MSEAVIDIQGLTKTYRSGVRRTPVHAVKDLALTVPRGAVVAWYAAAYFLAGCLFFTRRDIRLG